MNCPEWNFSTPTNMRDQLNELDKQQDAICQKLEERLTDLGKSILYKELTEVLKKKETIYKQQLENLKNEH